MVLELGLGLALALALGLGLGLGLGWAWAGFGLGLGWVWAGFGLGLSAQYAPQAAFAQIPDSGPNPSASRPALFSATTRTPKSIAYSATALIAAKPLKPCDGGVFLGAKFALKKRVEAHGRTGSGAAG